MRLPSNGMCSPISSADSSAIIFSCAASQVALSGQTSQENTTFSPSSSLTALRKSVCLPSGTSASQASTIFDQAVVLHDVGEFLRDRAVFFLLVARTRGRNPWIYMGQAPSVFRVVCPALRNCTIGSNPPKIMRCGRTASVRWTPAARVGRHPVMRVVAGARSGQPAR